jgi:hypothetical protein
MNMTAQCYQVLGEFQLHHMRLQLLHCDSTVLVQVGNYGLHASSAQPQLHWQPCFW